MSGSEPVAVVEIHAIEPEAVFKIVPPASGAPRVLPSRTPLAGITYGQEEDGMTWKHVAVVFLSLVATAGLVVGFMHYMAAAQVERQRTERVRLETCGKSEDPEQRIICLRGLG